MPDRLMQSAPAAHERKAANPVVAWVFLAVIGTTLSMCGGTASEAPPPNLPASSASRGASVVEASSSGSALVAPQPPTVSATAEPPGTDMDLTPLPPRATTSGKIQCETVDCDLATEICCVDAGIGRCIARSAAVGAAPCLKDSILPIGAAKIVTQERRCDESSDCGSGERCCESVEVDDGCQPSSAPRWRCAKQCRSSSGHSGEVCLRGSRCANGDCDIPGGTDEPALAGYCPATPPQLDCGGTKCTGNDVCCWNPKARAGRCAKPGSCVPQVETVQYACEHPTDCDAGYDCYNTSGSYYYETYACHQARCSSTKLFDGPYLCDTIADCPVALRAAHPSLKITAHAPDSCQPGSSDPSGVKVCHYR